jgi:hypothetical protein
MSNFTECRFIVTPQIITIIYKDKRYQFTSEKPNFEDVKNCIRRGDESGLIEQIASLAFIIPEFSNGLFRVDEKEETIIDVETNTKVGEVLGKRIIEWSKDGLPFAPLLNFHRNCLQNPSPSSVKDLYDFLEKNHVPITPDGTFIGYKKVTTVEGRLMDSRSKTIYNDPGRTVEIPREHVDPDSNQTCSHGLHVGAWQYVSGFTGDTIIAVNVHPKDVVAVPKDYDSQKMRVCKYKVLNIVGEETRASVVHDHNDVIVEVPNFANMTASQIKQHIAQTYGRTIEIDNKNKKAIIKAAYKIAGASGALDETNDKFKKLLAEVTSICNDHYSYDAVDELEEKYSVIFDKDELEMFNDLDNNVIAIAKAIFDAV